jgi:hypothetical protein
LFGFGILVHVVGGENEERSEYVFHALVEYYYRIQTNGMSQVDCIVVFESIVECEYLVICALHTYEELLGATSVVIGHRKSEIRDVMIVITHYLSCVQSIWTVEPSYV